MPQLHDIRLFVRNGKIVYIHHNTGNPNDDEPGDSVELGPGQLVRFKSKEGDVTITFDESPFVSGGTVFFMNRGAPTNPAEEVRDLDESDEGLLKSFKYTAELQGIEDDPEIIIDAGGGGGDGGDGGGTVQLAMKKKAKKKARKKKK